MSLDSLEDNRECECEHLRQMHKCRRGRYNGGPIRKQKTLFRFVEEYLHRNGPTSTLDLWEAVERTGQLQLKDFDMISLGMILGKSGLFRNLNHKTNEHNVWSLP